MIVLSMHFINIFFESSDTWKYLEISQITIRNSYPKSQSVVKSYDIVVCILLNQGYIDLYLNVLPANWPTWIY